MSLRRKLSPGFSRAVNYLLRSRVGVRHATGEPPDQDAATTMEKLDAAHSNMSHGLCMFGPDNRLLLWNDRYVKMYRLAPDSLRVGRTFDEMLEARKAGRSRSRSTGIWWRFLPVRARISSASVESDKSSALRRSLRPRDAIGLSASPLRPLTRRPTASWRACLSESGCPFPCR